MESPKLAPLLKLNDSFASYQELREAVEKYEKANRVQFWIRDAKRLHRAPPSIYSLVKNHPELEYCSLKLSCIHGGKAFQQKRNIFAKSYRKNRGTWKQDCKAEIFVKLNDDKDRLVISRIEEEHNHDVPTAEFVQHLPKLRRIADKRRSTKSQMFQDQFQHKIQEVEGIRLDNVVKANSLSRSKNFEKIAELLRDQYKCTVDLQQDENGKIFGFFFQDHQMKECFDLFPEILLVDGTYKLQNIRCCLYTISIENSMGSNSIVGVGVITVEDKASFDWLMERFKERNSKWPSTSIIVTDRQSCEYQIAQQFTSAAILICISHALYAFKKDLIQLKALNITTTEVSSCIENFQRLIHAESEEEYTAILEDIDDDMPYPFTEYYYRNWHNWRHIWVRGLSNLRPYVEGKLEDPNSRFRSLVGSCKTFRVFIEKLFATLGSQRNDLKRDYHRMAMKIFASEHQTEAEKSYNRCLTPFGFTNIQQHLEWAQKKSSKFSFKTEDSDIICQTNEGQFIISEYSCTCEFFMKIQLPCKHILVYRRKRKLNLFAECLFSKRWTRRHIKHLLGLETSVLQTEEKNSEEKFMEAESVCLGLAALCSEVGETEFRERMSLLLQIKKSWENQDEMVLETTESTSIPQAKVEVMDGSYEDEDDCKSEKIIFEVTS